MNQDDKTLGFTPVVADIGESLQHFTRKEPVPVFEGALVAAILTARELVINKGSAEGVTPGMKLKVLSDKPIEIKDPLTKKVIGTVDREKVRVETITVHEHITICRTYRVLAGKGSYAFATVADILSGSGPQPETLKVEQSNYVPPIAESESYVKVGDRVLPIQAGE